MKLNVFIPILTALLILTVPAVSCQGCMVVIGSKAAAADVASGALVAARVVGHPESAKVSWYTWVEGFYVVPNASRNYTVGKIFMADVGGYNAVYVANYTYYVHSGKGVLCFQLLTHSEYEEEWVDGVHWLGPDSDNACQYEIYNKGYWLNTEIKPDWLFGYAVKPVYITEDRQKATIVLLDPEGAVVDCVQLNVGGTWNVAFEWDEQGNKTWVSVKVERIGVEGVDCIWLTIKSWPLPREIKPYKVGNSYYVKVGDYIYPWRDGRKVVVATDGEKNHRIVYGSWVKAEVGKEFTVGGEKYVVLVSPDETATLYEVKTAQFKTGQEWFRNVTETVKTAGIGDEYVWEEGESEVVVRPEKLCIEAPAWGEGVVRLDVAVSPEDMEGNVILVGGPIANAWVEKLAEEGRLPVEIAKDYMVVNGIKWTRINGAAGITNGLGAVIVIDNPWGGGKITIIAGCDRYGTLAAAIGYVRGLAKGKVSLFAYTPDPAKDGKRVGPWTLVHPEANILPPP